MPNPGSLVRFKDGQYGIVVKVTPDGKADRIVPIGSSFPTAWEIFEIEEIIYEPEKNDEQKDRIL